MSEPVDPREFGPPSVTAPGSVPPGQVHPDFTLPPPVRPPTFGVWPPPSPPVVSTEDRPPSKAPRWVGPTIAGLCVAVIVVGIVIARSLGHDDEVARASRFASRPVPVVAPGHPSVIAYLDPKFPVDSISRVEESATKAVAARGLPFVVSADIGNHTVMLTANVGAGFQLSRGDVLTAYSLLRGMPHVLGVEAPTARGIPYCGTVPSAGRDPSTQSVADALLGLHLGEQDLEYYFRDLHGRIDVNSFLFQIRVDQEFRDRLASVALQGAAAEDQRRFLVDRAQFDATLETAAHQVNIGDDHDAHVSIEKARHERDVASHDLNKLRADLGLPANTCFFSYP